MSAPNKNNLRHKILDQTTSVLFVLPVILGILIFTLLPMFSSLYYSFTEYNTLISNQPQGFIGFQNYIDIFTIHWDRFGHSLGMTFVYALISVPLNLILSFALALPLAREIKGIKIYRTLIYAPVLIPMIISGFLWQDLTSSTGHFNLILKSVGLPAYAFFNSAETAMPSFLLMGLFTLGGSMVLWIAQIKAIPDSMYEVARIEGGKYSFVLFRVMIPMCTPMIFYNLVLSIVNSLQTYASAIVVRNIYNSEALDFFVGQIYDKIVGAGDLGLGSALSWILFVIIAVVSALTFKLNKWVYYEEEN